MASVSPTVAGARLSGASPRPGTARTARSRSGSKTCTWAGSVLPSGRRTVVFAVPATTWALVTTVSGAAANPLPVSRKPQAVPLTRTVDAVTPALAAGGVPGTVFGARAGRSRASRSLRTARTSFDGAAAGRVAGVAAAAGPAGGSAGEGGGREKGIG